MKEIVWKPVYGYEKNYEISTEGQVRSNYRGGRILCQAKHGGYMFVVLSKDKKKKPINVHRLVAKTFLGDFAGMQVNHKDGDKLNNCVDNLEWVSASENMAHAFKKGLIKSYFTTSGYKRLNGRAVQKIDPVTGSVICEYKKIMDARKDGFIDSGISLCIHGKQKTHKGYCWKYKYKHNERYDK